MRFRNSLLLLAISLSSVLALAQEPASSTSNPDTHLQKRAETHTDQNAVPQSPKKPDKGTRDAPVDGLDGKPHAGPFVTNPLWVPPEADGQNHPSGDQAEPSKDRQLPEDGVMNDRNRQPPRKGTTGTEGGMSEKERARISKESEMGQTVPKTPSQPKEAPHAHYSENDKGTKGTTGTGKTSKTGGVILQRPDLPAKEYGTPNEHGKDYGGYGGHTENNAFDHHWDHEHEDEGDDDHDHLLDGDDDDDEDEDGKYDIIPWDSLAGSFSSIAATEIGDKTFIVAALMAMRHPRIQVFSAAFSALFIMTILSGVLGHALGAIISKKWSALAAALLFLVFGAKSVRDGAAMSPHQGVSDEIREVEAELEEKEEDMAKQANGHGRDSAISPYALEAGRAGGGRRSRSRSRLSPPRRSPSSSASRSRSRVRRPLSSAMSGARNLLSLLLSPAWVETFSMTFVGELGDRSQIATVAMAAGQEYFWVMVGASLGHFVCTGVAVLGGSVLAGRVSLRKVTLIGGGIFIAFGCFTLLEAIQYWH